MTDSKSPASSKPGALVVLRADELRELIEQSIEKFFEGAAPANDTPAVLDRKGIAKKLDVSVATLDRLVIEGLPHFFVGDVKRFELEPCIAWLKARPR
jgi:hypothetical protein